MLKRNYSLDEIEVLTRLSSKELEKLAKEA